MQICVPSFCDLDLEVLTKRLPAAAREQPIQFTGQQLITIIYFTESIALLLGAIESETKNKELEGERPCGVARDVRRARVSLFLSSALRQGLDRGAAAGYASVCPDGQHSTRSSTSRSPAVTKW